ncbi:MAG: MerR family transcriptional regulator [Oscillospiraceae bacterium]|nr:MerR family transcriptional regulator [Oscillospiraceae bacterium]
MNTKQAQQLSGVSADNIRFYEKQGLLSPLRNPDNDYRDYSPEDIRTLKRIRALRMLDMPLPQIKAVLTNQLPLSAALQAQRQRLEEQSLHLEQAIRLCGKLATLPGLEELDVDALLSQMDAPERAEGFFQGWLNDYRQVALAEREKRFTFLPDGPVTTPREFSEALFQYAQENGLELTITKEGMYPQFTIDGVEYTAQRSYTAVRGFPVASIACEVLHPGDFEPQDLSPLRRRIQRLLHFLWLPSLLFLLFLLPRRELLNTWEGRLLLLSLLTLTAVLSFRSWLLFYNENGKTRRK